MEAPAVMTVHHDTCPAARRRWRQCQSA